MTNNPLLSVIIPTKNRQYTCLFAIESVLAIKNQDYEIIVQDCSDTDILRDQIKERFSEDGRIKYFYTNAKPSMTDNWNMAYANAIGEYQCAIGDDDAVFSEIYEVAKWAKQHQIDVINQPNCYDYKWPDFDDQALNGHLIIEQSFTGDTKTFNDYEQRLSYNLHKVDLSYVNLPMAYHCLLSKKIIELIKHSTGIFLDGTSLDVYSSCVIGFFSKQWVTVNYPITLRGACGQSNSNRILKKDNRKHFEEYSDLAWPKELPPIHSLQTTIGESMIKALTNINQENRKKEINFAKINACSTLERRESFHDILRFLSSSNTSLKGWCLFSKELVLQLSKDYARKIGLTQLLRRSSVKEKIPCNTIIEALIWHKNNNKVALGFVEKQ